MLTSLKKQHQDACHNHAYPDALLPATGPIGKDLSIYFSKEYHNPELQTSVCCFFIHMTKLC